METKNITSKSDNELALLAKEGNSEARNALYLRYRRLVRKRSRPAKEMLERANGDLVDRDDIDQQAFIIFCDLLADWDPARAPFVPYCMSILPWRLHHYVRDSLGYRSKLEIVPFEEPGDDSEDEMGQVAGREQAPEETVSEAEAWEEHTAGLAPRHRRSLDLRFYLDMPRHKIATLNQESLRTVDREIQAALSAVRREITDEWEGCA